jgi:hypothetical protein
LAPVVIGGLSSRVFCDYDRHGIDGAGKTGLKVYLVQDEQAGGISKDCHHYGAGKTLPLPRSICPERPAFRTWRLAKATGTPFWVMQSGRIVNLNPDAKSGRKRRAAPAKPGKRAKELAARARKGKTGSLKRVRDKIPHPPPAAGGER